MENEDLETLRKALRTVDKDMVALFDKRVAISKSIAQVKMRSATPVYDAAREEKNIEELSKLVTSISERPDFIRWYQMLMDISKKVQRRVVEKKGK